MDYSPWNSVGQNTGMGSLSLLQGIFPTKGSNPGLPHCVWILFQLSQKGSPELLKESVSINKINAHHEKEIHWGDTFVLLLLLPPPSLPCLYQKSLAVDLGGPVGRWGSGVHSLSLPTSFSQAALICGSIINQLWPFPGESPLCSVPKSFSRCVAFSRIQLFTSPGFSVHAILQTRILEWIAVSFSRGSSQPKDQICISCTSWIAGDSLPLCHLGSQVLADKSPAAWAVECLDGGL